MAAGKLVFVPASLVHDARLPETDRRRCNVTAPNRPFAEQAIAAPRLGSDRLTIWAQCPAHRPGENLQCVFRDDGAGPELVHQFVFGHKLAGRLDKNFEKIEGPSSDRYRSSVDAKFAANEVYLALA